MFFVGPPPRHAPPEGTGRQSDVPDAEPVPGFRSLLPLQRTTAVSCELCEGPSGRLAVVTVGNAPLAHGLRIGYLDWLERLAGIADHRYVADVLAGGVTAEHRPYVAVRAGVDTLAGRLRDAGSAPAEVVRSLGTGLAEALGLAHERALLHGTVQPATVIVDEAGTPMLAGFDNVAPGMEHPPAPSPYTAPELLPRIGAGRSAASTAGDVYGLTATLFVMAGGRLPWAVTGEPRRCADPARRGLPVVELGDLPGVIARVVHRGLVPNAEQRLTLPALRGQLAAVELNGVDRPGQPIPDALLGSAGIRSLLAPPTDRSPALAATPATPPALPAKAPALPATPPALPGVPAPADVPPPALSGPFPEPVDAVPLTPPGATAEPTPVTVPTHRRRRVVTVAAGLAVSLVAVAAVAALGGFGQRPVSGPGPDPDTGGQQLRETPAAAPSLGPGKTVAGPASPTPSPSESPSASTSPTRRSSPSPTPSRTPALDHSVAALAGRWSELQPWEDGQSFLKFSRSGQMTLTGPFNCSGRAQTWDSGSRQRTYELFHNCNDSGYAVIVLSDDGRRLAVYWYQNVSDQYARD